MTALRPALRAAQRAAAAAEGRERLVQSLPSLPIARQTEAKPPGIVREHAYPNAGAAKVLEQGARNGRLHEPEQACAADNRKSGTRQHAIELGRNFVETTAGAGDPLLIRKRARPDRERGSGNRPWPERCAQTLGERRRRERKAEP
jgi:hypothetical protein